tara:strand:- start:161 stop:421 length:261 start_codon:yes stop_codon:yes gene_type:complete
MNLRNYQNWFGHLHLNMTEACSETNPALWAMFCALNRRDPLQFMLPTVWTELDVLSFFGEKIEEAHTIEMAARMGPAVGEHNGRPN